MCDESETDVSIRKYNSIKQPQHAVKRAVKILPCSTADVGPETLQTAEGLHCYF